MNHGYDRQKAANVVGELRTALTSIDGIAVGPTLLSQLKVQELELVDTKYPPSTRVMVQRDGEKEEAVFRTFGVICGKSLPPYLEKPPVTSLRQIRNLKQEVKITGFNTAGFEQDRIRLQEIEALFAAHAQGRTVLPCDFVPFEGHPCIDIHARFFTDRSLVPYDQNQEFLPGVDPQGVLSAIQPDDFIHGPDNMVEYCRRFSDENGFSYLPYEPAHFKVGDVVEVAFSCVAVPIKNNRVRTLLNLRALTLVDDAIRKEAERVGGQSGMNTMRRTPKRKALYLNFDYSQPYEKRRRPSPSAVPYTTSEHPATLTYGRTEASEAAAGQCNVGGTSMGVKRRSGIRDGRAWDGERQWADAKLSLDAAVESMSIDER